MQVQERIVEFFVLYGFKIVGGLLILTVGLLLAAWLGRWLQRWLGHVELEPPVRLLFVRVARLIVIGFTLVLVAAKLGVDIGPLVAGIGIIGVGLGLASQGVLSNVFAGLVIIFSKPFRVGEYIEIIGVEGQVASIDLLSTTLLHADKSKVVIPNRKIVGEILHNYGAIRQLNLALGVAYGTDLQRLETVARDILTENVRVLKTPPPVFGITSLADSSISVSIQPWVAVADFGRVQSELYAAVMERFKANGIEMPFPQREIRILGAAS